MSSVNPTATPEADKAIPPPELQPFGSYLLLHAFARGGMGEVYLARIAGGVNEDQYCVLKKLRPELTQDREYIRRFIDEARVVVQLHHPNICHVFDVGRVAEEYYLAMEYVSGHDARSIQNRARELGRSLPVGCVLHLVCEILEALDYAHQRNHPLTGESLHLIHRDVSPQNVLIRYDGAVKLIDFGLASSKLKMERTQPNVVMGKMAYMAPEQARGESIDASIDLFAVAVLAYELLSGERYYEGMLAQEIWAVVGRGDFVPRHWAKLPPALTKILSRALHENVAKRFPSAQDFRQAILQYLDKEHPEAGKEQLSSLLGELFVDEKKRAEQMMRRLEMTRSTELSEAMEVSRSLSVSLAQSEYSMNVAIAAGKNSKKSDWELDTQARQARLSQTLLAAVSEEHEVSARHALKLVTSSEVEMTGTAEPTVATQKSIASFQRERGTTQKRVLARALYALIAGAALFGAYAWGLYSSSTREGGQASLFSPAEASEAFENEPKSKSKSKPEPKPERALPSTESEDARLPSDTADESERSTKPRKISSKNNDSSSKSELISRKRRKRKEQRLSEPTSTTQRDALSPDVKSERAAPSAAALATAVEAESRRGATAADEDTPSQTLDGTSELPKSRPAKAQRIAAKSSKTADKRTKTPSESDEKPIWQSLNRRERLGMLKTCADPCRQKTSAEFVRLQIKMKTASPAERSVEEQKFDELWQRCFQVCTR